MIAALSFMNATKNLWLLGVAVVLGGAIVTGIYMAGVRHEQRKWALEMADRNKDLVEQRGTDTAEIAATDKANEQADTVVAGAIGQSCPVTAETARLLAEVR
jgi:uncharacterized protein DUF2514